MSKLEEKNEKKRVENPWKFNTGFGILGFSIKTFEKTFLTRNLRITLKIYQNLIWVLNFLVIKISVIYMANL